jgi:hypothetical protein
MRVTLAAMLIAVAASGCGGGSGDETCDYTLSAWSSCSQDGLQTREVIAADPPGCSKRVTLSQACVPYCSPRATAWTECDPETGYQAQIVTAYVHEPCDGLPVAERPPLLLVTCGQGTWTEIRVEPSASYPTVISNVRVNGTACTPACKEPWDTAFERWFFPGPILSMTVQFPGEPIPECELDLNGGNSFPRVAVVNGPDTHECQFVPEFPSDDFVNGSTRFRTVATLTKNHVGPPVYVPPYPPGPI